MLPNVVMIAWLERLEWPPVAQSKGNYLYYQVMVGGRRKVVDGYTVDGQLQARAAVVCDLLVKYFWCEYPSDAGFRAR